MKQTLTLLPRLAALRTAVPSVRRLARSVGLLVAVTALAPSLAMATIVRFETGYGPVDIQLYDTATPATVANFLNYVNRGAYNGSFFHRSVPGFVIQGGGYAWNTAAGPLKISADAPVVNEFNVNRSNLRGTVAMAKLGGDPNSATTEWFVNLTDNAANLDTQNGGFTVFGKVTTPAMRVVDAFVALQTVNFSSCTVYGSAFSAVPVYTAPASCAATTPQMLTQWSSARVLAVTSSDTDRVLNYLEAVYPQYLAPAGTALALDAPTGISYRYYSVTNAYVGTKDGVVYYLVPAINDQINTLGSLASFMAEAIAAGY